MYVSYGALVVFKLLDQALVVPVVFDKHVNDGLFLCIACHLKRPVFTIADYLYKKVLLIELGQVPEYFGPELFIKLIIEHGNNPGQLFI